MTKIKVGKLKKGFEIRTIEKIVVKIPKNTIVVAKGRTVTFLGYPIKIIKKNIGGKVRYIALIYGKKYVLEEFTPKIPYPISMAE